MAIQLDAGHDDAPLILHPRDHVVLGESDFGMPGLVAVESIGPFSPIQASGPLITVHDSTIRARMGIGHHPHRFNERLFYIERGELDHDDARNAITGHMDEGDVGQFVEGRRGMVHSEWNHGDSDTHAFILVVTTDPVPEATAFHVLKDDDAPRLDEGPGVRTKVLVGDSSSLRVHGDVRSFTDSVLGPDAAAALHVAEGEGGLVSVREGTLLMADDEIGPGTTLIVPPAPGRRELAFQAVGHARVIRVVHGPGEGLVTGRPLPRR